MAERRGAAARSKLSEAERMKTIENRVKFNQGEIKERRKTPVKYKRPEESKPSRYTKDGRLTKAEEKRLESLTPRDRWIFRRRDGSQNQLFRDMVKVIEMILSDDSKPKKKKHFGWLFDEWWKRVEGKIPKLANYDNLYIKKEVDGVKQFVRLDKWDYRTRLRTTLKSFIKSLEKTHGVEASPELVALTKNWKKTKMKKGVSVVKTIAKEDWVGRGFLSTKPVENKAGRQMDLIEMVESLKDVE